MNEAQKAAEAGEGAEQTLLDGLLSKVEWKTPSEAEDAAVVEDQSKQRLSVAVNYFLSELLDSGKKVEKLDKDAIDKIIEGIDEKMSKQISAIMHHPTFQEMESNWRGLKYLVDHTNFRANIKVEILNVSKEDLRSDLEDAPELLQSGLFHHVYKQEYDQAGGDPVAAIVGNYYFDNSSADVAMLKNLSQVGAGCHAPFISSVSSEMFGQKDATQLHKIKDMEDHFEQSEYTKWRSLRETEDSRYLGLCFPRFMLRPPYDPESRPMNEFNFVEDVTGSQHDKFLWGNASLAFAARMTESFARHGWCVNIRGPQSGGMVEDLPVFNYVEEGEKKTKIPTEVMISDRVELELAESGFIPLTFYKNTDHACFFSAQSAQKPKKYNKAEATANAKLSANLPYLMLASRLSHYLKVIQRENIGAAKEKQDLQKELDEWIQRLVTNMPGAGADLKARRPLKHAQIIVEDLPESPGWYDVKMFVRPHFQVEGINVELSLVSKMPKAQENK
ncbi:MAG: type VI secretion system contractile sheath large subunit [Acidobacteriota bacterium]|nr:type VI secretion system contractile sheath large subunit [Acidobacteriota bacterium]